PYEHTDIALRIAEIGPVGPFCLARDRQVEREAVLERHDGAAPAVRACLQQMERRREAIWLDPESVAQCAFAVGEVEGEGLALELSWHGEARDVGAPAVRCAVNDKRAVDVG